MEFPTLRKIEPEHFHNFTQINLGDGTLLASLRSLSQGRSTVILDNNTEITVKLLNELLTGTPVFSFLADSKKLYYQYASISEKILKDANLAAQMRKIYLELWKEAKRNLNLLFIVNSSIEEATKEIREPRPVADLVTYFYPSHQYSPLFKALELASLFLKPEGEFVMATEYKDISDVFTNLGGGFVVKSGFKERSNDPYLSAYDIAWGQKGHYQVRIKNKGNKLHEHISTMKKGLAFRVVSALGMVR